MIGSKDARERVQLGIVTRYRLDLDPASCALSECAIRDNASSTPWNAWRWLTVRATVPGLWGAVGPFVAVLVVVVATAIVTGFGATATRATPRRALVLAGAKVVGQAGCLACHRIGAEGTDGRVRR